VLCSFNRIFAPNYMISPRLIRKEMRKFKNNYGLTTDYNAECDHEKGSNIFIHCKGYKPYTGGCISFDEDKMIEILRRCDTSLIVKISE